MQENVKEIAVELVVKYFGDHTASLYKEFYKDKDAQLIVSSISELLKEYLGNQKADEILRKYNLLEI